jgi:hypothetical protein
MLATAPPMAVRDVAATRSLLSAGRYWDVAR